MQVTLLQVMPPRSLIWLLTRWNVPSDSQSPWNKSASPIPPNIPDPTHATFLSILLCHCSSPGTSQVPHTLVSGFLVSNLRSPLNFIVCVLLLMLLPPSGMFHTLPSIKITHNSSFWLKPKAFSDYYNLDRAYNNHPHFGAVKYGLVSWEQVKPCIS